MVNVRDAPVRTVDSVVTVLIKRSSVDRVGRSNVACAGDASAYMYKHTMLRVLNLTKLFLHCKKFCRICQVPYACFV